LASGEEALQAGSHLFGVDLLAMARPESTNLVERLDRVWAAMSDRRFNAVLEAWSAAANDPELATEITPAVAWFATVVSVHDRRRGEKPDPDVRAFVLVPIPPSANGVEHR
jgi:hypothetical protein